MHPDYFFAFWNSLIEFLKYFFSSIHPFFDLWVQWRSDMGACFKQPKKYIIKNNCQNVGFKEEANVKAIG
jgi:hypothetical protein